MGAVVFLDSKDVDFLQVQDGPTIPLVNFKWGERIPLNGFVKEFHWGYKPAYMGYFTPRW